MDNGCAPGSRSRSQISEGASFLLLERRRAHGGVLPLSLQVEFGGLGQNCADAPGLAPQKQRTKPLIPEMCFTTTGCSTDINLSTPYLEEDGTSILVSCKKCSVRVHASECLTFSLCPVPGAWACSSEVLAPISFSPSLLWPPQGLPSPPSLPEQRLRLCPWGVC